MIFSINSDPTSIYQIYDFDLPFAMICSKVCGWSHLVTREGACRTCPFWLVLKLLLSEHEIMTQVSISFSLCKSERHGNSIFGILSLIKEIPGTVIVRQTSWKELCMWLIIYQPIQMKFGMLVFYGQFHELLSFLKSFCYIILDTRLLIRVYRIIFLSFAFMFQDLYTVLINNARFQLGSVE